MRVNDWAVKRSTFSVSTCSLSEVFDRRSYWEQNGTAAKDVNDLKSVSPVLPSGRSYSRLGKCDKHYVVDDLEDQNHENNSLFSQIEIRLTKSRILGMGLAYLDEGPTCSD